MPPQLWMKDLCLKAWNDFNGFAVRFPTFKEYRRKVKTFDDYDYDCDKHQTLLFFTAVISAGRNNRMLMDWLQHLPAELDETL
jgi:hypothetical protein